MAKILVVDDERLICDLLETVLTRQGHDVLTATGGTEALKLFREQRPRVTLLDLRMPDMDGIAVLKQIRAIDPKASVIILTGGGTAEWEKQAYEAGL
ncbi:MAG: response regulator [Nitrospirota bacterium]